MTRFGAWIGLFTLIATQTMWLPAGTPPICNATTIGALWYAEGLIQICTMENKWKALQDQENHVVCIPAEEIDSGAGILGGFHKGQVLCVFLSDARGEKE